jgi:hypothetical protein
LGTVGDVESCSTDHYKIRIRVIDLYIMIYLGEIPINTHPRLPREPFHRLCEQRFQKSFQ